MNEPGLHRRQPRPWGITGLSVAFAVGSVAGLAAVASILFPGTPFDALWRHHSRAQMLSLNAGLWAALPVFVVSTACLLSALALWLGVSWGRWLAIGILLTSGLVDVLRLVGEKDTSAALGLPIVLILVAYMCSDRVRDFFLLEPSYW